MGHKGKSLFNEPETTYRSRYIKKYLQENGVKVSDRNITKTLREINIEILELIGKVDRVVLPFSMGAIKFVKQNRRYRIDKKRTAKLYEEDETMKEAGRVVYMPKMMRYLTGFVAGSNLPKHLAPFLSLHLWKKNFYKYLLCTDSSDYNRLQTI